MSEVTIRRASLRSGERVVKQGAVTRKEKAWHERRAGLSAKTKQAARRRYNRVHGSWTRIQKCLAALLARSGSTEKGSK